MYITVMIDKLINIIPNTEIGLIRQLEIIKTEVKLAYSDDLSEEELYNKEWGGWEATSLTIISGLNEPKSEWEYDVITLFYGLDEEEIENYMLN